jgi:hypothetical protein
VGVVLQAMLDSMVAVAMTINPKRVISFLLVWVVIELCR